MSESESTSYWSHCTSKFASNADIGGTGVSPNAKLSTLKHVNPAKVFVSVLVPVAICEVVYIIFSPAPYA